MITAKMYHEVVAHHRDRLARIKVDWVNQPTTFKSYSGQVIHSLPRDADMPQVSLWDMPAPSDAASMNLEKLSAILFHGSGLTRANRHKSWESFYRACPSAGALYPCEVYLAWPGSPELDAGLYHYDVGGHGLTALRTGYPEPGALGLPVRSSLPGEALLLVSAIFYRSAWKYRTRAYRYLNLDAGHVVEGLSLGLAAYGIPYRVEPVFSDTATADFLGIDPAMEGCLSVIRFPGHAGNAGYVPLGPLPPDSRSFSRCAPVDTPMEGLLAVHASCSRIAGPDAVMPAPEHMRLGARLSWQELSYPAGVPEPLHLFEAMASRRSRRNFVVQERNRGNMAKVLAALHAPLYPPGGHPAENACGVGVLMGDRLSLQAGYYLLDRGRMRAGLRRQGDMRSDMAMACLGQQWLGHASMLVLFFADFTELEPCLGDRGYRQALQGAGRLGHRLYLAAESLGLGACGVGAFFDDDAARLLELPEGAGLLYVVAVGPTRSV